MAWVGNYILLFYEDLINGLCPNLYADLASLF